MDKELLSCLMWSGGGELEGVRRRARSGFVGLEG